MSERARATLVEAEAGGDLVVSVATMIDLWYVSQTTKAVTAAQLGALRERLVSSEAVTLEPVSLAVVDAAATIPRATLADPWDRLIVATALAFDVPLVSRDEAIEASRLVSTIW